MQVIGELGYHSKTRYDLHELQFQRYIPLGNAFEQPYLPYIKQHRIHGAEESIQSIKLAAEIIKNLEIPSADVRLQSPTTLQRDQN